MAVRHTEKLTPIAAAASAMATLACCLPVGFATAAAVAAMAAVVEPLRPWLIAASVALLAVGVVQVTRYQRTCAVKGRTSWVSIAILVTATIVVLLVTLFPQIIAGVLADWMP